MDILIANRWLLFCTDFKNGNPIEYIDEKELFSKWCYHNKDTISDVIDKYIDETPVKELENDIVIIKERIEIFYKNMLNEEQITRLETCIQFFLDYPKSRKTKRKKEELKDSHEFIKNLSIEIQLNLFNSLFLINDINMIGLPVDITNPGNEIIYNGFIENYKDLCDNLETLKKYNKYIIESSKSKLEEYFENEKKQKGKYYKKWSLLTEEEKKERIVSYVNCYCLENNIENEEMMKYIENNMEQLNSKWNIKNGMVMDLNVKYTNGSFTIVEKKKTVKKNKIRFSDKDVNDIILKGLISKTQKEDIYSQISTNLQIKKLSKQETEILDERYNEFMKLMGTL